ncbi:MAG: histidine phosphatase family protein [Planctomycetes bacterium]|nr:histidine phosphatase family protein [Planctomycetota bacterium]
MSEKTAVSEQKAQNIWICRHGNRIDLVDPSWQGDDPYLSDDGFVQARETGERLKGEGIQEIFASPFLRTMQTANCIAEALDLPIKIEYGICEWLSTELFDHMPVCLTASERAERFPRIDTSYKSLLDPQWPESVEMIEQRCAQIVNHVADTYASDILFVGHAASVYSCAQGLLPVKTHIEPLLCSLTKIQRLPSGGVMELNCDTSHLSVDESAS